MDIADFLRARYDEDREDAERGYLRAPEIPDYQGWDKTTIAALSPAVARRVLADIAAKREVVTIELCRALDAGVPNANRSAVCRLLSVPYASHPDYQREWHPQADDHDPVSP